MQQIHRKKSAKSLYFRISIPPHLQILISGVMALRHKIEWDPEEVAAGYDLSSIYEGLGENSTVPVISSVANITDPAVNITTVVREAAKQVAEMVVKTTNTTLNPATIASTTVAPPSGFTPSTVSTIVKRVVEHLGREPSSPVATVCIYIFFLRNIQLSIFRYCLLHFVSYITLTYLVHFIIQYIILYNLFYRSAAFRPHSLSC